MRTVMVLLRLKGLIIECNDPAYHCRDGNVYVWISDDAGQIKGFAKSQRLQNAMSEAMSEAMKEIGNRNDGTEF
jgi:hypothetical protein